MPYGPFAKSAVAEDYEFHCSAPDCAEHSHDQDDFLKCEACNCLACMAHARYAENDLLHRFCEACFRCSVCRDTAQVACEECGRLLCKAHANEVAGQVDEWNTGDTHYGCRGVCGAFDRKPAQAETQAVLKHYGVA